VFRGKAVAELNPLPCGSYHSPDATATRSHVPAGYLSRRSRARCRAGRAPPELADLRAATCRRQLNTDQRGRQLVSFRLSVDTTRVKGAAVSRSESDLRERLCGAAAWRPPWVMVLWCVCRACTTSRIYLGATRADQIRIILGCGRIAVPCQFRGTSAAVRADRFYRRSSGYMRGGGISLTEPARNAIAGGRAARGTPAGQWPQCVLMDCCL